MPCRDTSPVGCDVSGGEEGLHTGGPGAGEILVVGRSARHKGDPRQVWGPGGSDGQRGVPRPVAQQARRDPCVTAKSPLGKPLPGVPSWWGCTPPIPQPADKLLTPQPQGHSVQEATVFVVAAVGSRGGQAGTWQHQGSLLDGRALWQCRGTRPSPLHRRAGEERQGRQR